MDQPGKNSEEPPVYPEPNNNTDAAGSSLPGTSKADGKQSPAGQTVAEELYVNYVLLKEVWLIHEINLFNSICYSGISTLNADGSAQSLHYHRAKVVQAVVNPKSTDVEPIHKYLAHSHKRGNGFHHIVVGSPKPEARARQLAEQIKAATARSPLCLLNTDYAILEREDYCELARSGKEFLLENLKLACGDTLPIVDIKDAADSSLSGISQPEKESSAGQTGTEGLRFIDSKQYKLTDVSFDQKAQFGLANLLKAFK